MLFLVHLIEPDLQVVDEEGVYLTGLAAAREFAANAARDILVADLTAGVPLNLDRYINICDEDGSLLSVVTFSDAVRRTDHHLR